MGFDKKRWLEAFKNTVYPVLRANCSACHSTQNTTGSGAQAPLHSDVDVTVAHEYALTRVNFREPANSRLVARMRIDRHNCFGGSCAAAGDRMRAAISAWRDAVADMVPEIPRGIEASKKITDQQVLDCIAADQAKAPAASREYVFELYALSGTLNLPADATRAQLLDAMKDIIVGKAASVGRFRQ
jgi:hypothetical protein